MSFPSIIILSNNKHNILVKKMDNPNITIKELFAKAQTSMKKYEDKQKLAKKKSHPTKHRSTTATTRRFSRKVSQDASDMSVIDDPRSAASSDDNRQQQGYVPLCEVRRHKEKAALEALRARLSNNSKNRTTPKFKPLSWDKPSFHFPLPKICESSCSSKTEVHIGQKRKAASQQDEVSTSSVADNTKSTESILTMARPLNSGAISISTSAAASLPSSLPYSHGCSSFSASNTTRTPSHIHRPRWSDDEVRGLLDFANKWITPDMGNSKRRKMG